MIGIVASRLVERFGRPVVLIAGEGDSWKGSGRSVPSFDLHAGLAACADHLERFGGHRAAAGLSIRGDELEPFAAAFAAHADGELLDEDLAPVTRIDAIVPASALTLELARELEQLSPFGLGNPDVTLLVAGLRGGRRLDRRRRASTCASACASTAAMPAARSRSGSAASSSGSRAPRASTWRSGSSRTAGTAPSSPQLVVRRVFDTAAAYEELRLWLAELWRAGETAWTPEARRVFDELAHRGCGRQAAAARVTDLPGRCSSTARRSRCRRRRSRRYEPSVARRRRSAPGRLQRRRPGASRACRATRSSSASSRSTRRRSRYRWKTPMASVPSASGCRILSLERAQVD